MHIIFIHLLRKILGQAYVNTWKKRKRSTGACTSSLAKGYDLLYSSLPLASLDGFSRSHGDSLYVMQLVVAATNQNTLYTSRLLANKDIFSIYNSRYRFALIVCQWFYIKCFTNLRLKISLIIILSQFSGHSNERKWKPRVDWLKMTSLQGRNCQNPASGSARELQKSV